MKRLFLSFMSLLSMAVVADEAVVVGASSIEPLSQANLAQWSMGLLFVLLLILMGAWLLKRFVVSGSGANRPLNVLSGISLGGREKVVLIQAGEQRLLLGVSPGRVVKLHTFDKGELTGFEHQANPSFQDSLNQFVKVKKKS